MKGSGIRSIDNLGRLVIPKEVRRALNITEGEPVEIFVNRSGEIVLKKFSPLADISSFVQQYAEAINDTTHKNVLIVDRENIVSVAGDLKHKYLNRRLSRSLMEMVDLGVLKIEPQKDVLEVIEGEATVSSFVLAPIRVNGDSLGMIIIMGTAKDEMVNEGDISALKVASKFLEKYLEG